LFKFAIDWKGNMQLTGVETQTFYF